MIPNQFQPNSCFLDVSLNNRYLEGGYLKNLLSRVNKKHSVCFVNLGDTLHRHNLLYEDNVDMDTAHNKARGMGDEWLNKNLHIVDSSLLIPYSIIRSDDWLNESEFYPIHESLLVFYDECSSFRQIVNKDIEDFLQRKLKQKMTLISPNIDAIKSASFSYLIEEIAADILVGKRGGVTHIYPGRQHRS